MEYEKKENCPLTLSASQTLTVLSKDEVARRNMLGLKRTSVISLACSSRVVFGDKESANHSTAYNAKRRE